MKFISRVEQDINLIFPRNHVIFSIYLLFELHSAHKKFDVRTGPKSPTVVWHFQ